MSALTTHVVIVGAGPTGLMLAHCCARQQIDFVLLETRTAPSAHTRAIGIHSPSLLLFERLGLLPDLLKAGNRIDQGAAHLEHDRIGVIDFSSQPVPHPFIVTLAQPVTESLLRKPLETTSPDRLLFGQTVEALASLSHCLQVHTAEGHTITARYVIACDGADSVVRRQAGVPVQARPYDDSYVMADFADTIGDRHQAHVHLCRQGLVESFPHGTSQRRWVVRTETLREADNVGFIVDALARRTGHRPLAETVTMTSAFQPRRMLARTFKQGRVLLAGDAAHVISPIGGQGMNLGWLDAADWAAALATKGDAALTRCAHACRARARRAARQAEFNMALGRPFHSLPARRMLLKTLLWPPVQRHFVRRFSMHYLGEPQNAHSEKAVKISCIT